MNKKTFMILIMLLILLPTVGCGIPPDAYETAIKERDAAQASLQKATTELESARVVSGLAPPAVANPMVPRLLPSPVAARMALAEQMIAFDSLRAQAMRTRNDLKDEEGARKLEEAALTVMKTFDQLVKDAVDTELSNDWYETFPPPMRQLAENTKRPAYNVGGWIKFLERLKTLLGEDRSRLAAPR